MSTLYSSLFQALCFVVLFNASYSHALAPCATPSSKENYFAYLKHYPETLGPVGNAMLGEIEIIDDLQTITDIEQSTGRQVGVVAEDKYWLWLNDAVKFPNGSFGVYGRLIWRGALAGTGGVAVMPVLSDGKVCLNRNFRHATRSWEYELPRGGIQENETVEEAALRELREETGLIVDELKFLGQMNPDSGMTSTTVSVFLGRVLWQENAQPEDSEAIAAVEAFSVEEIKQGFIDGHLSVEVKGKIHRIHLGDPFLAFALLQAELRHEQ
jgi:ADP-ribose pyrophosphatase